VLNWLKGRASEGQSYDKGSSPCEATKKDESRGERGGFGAEDGLRTQARDLVGAGATLLRGKVPGREGPA
jgi:hypothetical protein